MAGENLVDDMKDEIARRAFEYAKKEAEAKAKAAADADGLKQGSKDAIQGVKEDIWGRDDIVPFEPEVLKPYQDAGLKPITKIIKGREVLFYTYSGAPDGVIKYVFERTLYEQQVALFRARLAAPQAKVANYRTRAAVIRNAIEGNKKEFRRQEVKIATQAKASTDNVELAMKILQIEIGNGMVHPGDPRYDALTRDVEKAQKAQIADVGLSELFSDGFYYEKFVYSGWIKDVDKKTQGKEFYPDLRVLADDYDARAESIEDSDIEILNDKLKKTEDAVENVKEAYEEYLEQMK